MAVGIVRIPRAAAIACVMVATACGDGFSPSMETVAGQYTATTLTVTSGGITTDELARGGSLSLSLAANGTTSGQLVMSDFIESMAGTWLLTGDKVTLPQNIDPLMRDMTFTVTADELRADGMSGGAQVRITLRRTGG